MDESEAEAESDPETAATEEEDEKPLQEILVADGEDIEIVSIDESDEEEDEILNALDRYFEAPGRDGEDEKA